MTADWHSPVKLIRTLGRVPMSISIIDSETIPIYQRIASEALRLNDLGYSNRRIVRKLDVNRNVVAKAIRWIR